MELKNKMIELKNSIDSLNNRIAQTKEITTDIEDRSIEINQS